MVYNDGQAGIDSVRLAAGNLLPEDYSDTDIAMQLEEAYAECQLISHKLLGDPYPDTVAEYFFLKALERKIAAMNCLKAYGPEFESKVVELRTEIVAAEALFKENTVIPELTVEAAEAEEVIVRSDFKSWNLNPDVSTPNRLKTSHSGSIIESQN